jgi:hypothetical protein
MATKTRISIGDLVIVNFGSERVRAEILEERGPLGPAGVHVYRVGWTPVGSDERLEFEVGESELIGAVSQTERARALARMDEFSARSPLVGVTPQGALAKVQEARALLGNAVAAAIERGDPKDFELVHRYCVEELGPAALHARRHWTDAANVPHVNPTLGRLPAMIEEAPPRREWILAANPVASWYESISTELDKLRSLKIEDRDTGATLVRIIGYCAEMAAWIRTTFGVGD